MKIRERIGPWRPVLVGMLWLPAALSLAQTSPGNAAKEPADAGAIVMPPNVGDRGAMEKAPPAAVDPGMVERPRPGRDSDASRARPAPSSPGSGSKDSSCTGPPELCRQSTPR